MGTAYEVTETCTRPYGRVLGLWRQMSLRRGRALGSRTGPGLGSRTGPGLGHTLGRAWGHTLGGGLFSDALDPFRCVFAHKRPHFRDELQVLHPGRYPRVILSTCGSAWGAPSVIAAALELSGYRIVPLADGTGGHWTSEPVWGLAPA